MKVLLTRPLGRNQAMAEVLTSMGIEHQVTPLLAVAPTPVEQHLLTPEQVLTAEVIIFVSTNAVIYGQQALGQPWPSDKQYFAVGNATWQALTAAGITGLQAPDDCQETEGLLALPELQQVAGKQIVIVRGNGGREDLGIILKQRGAQVNFWQVYQRICPAIDGTATAIAWKKFGIDTIVITSGAVLDNLITLVPKDLFPWLQACHIIVPSNRVKSQAIAKGMLRVTNAGGAHSQAMLAAL
ncbi:uroporphyrinogen-III synthase [Shewanella sp. NIFS-20-20]|uniref:uroporphyrinogen-III synthase n=1 Tax=Shewanella sp. NIFS-20-20 TaxID=2853806 RepID=UPI001C46EA3F|nr:uroporphyrinogen-III synthase [Shewanella sp. NIFS-20-20]MBV7317270.1 uroporphyrinogen-III synthase [Shewanella sp. NIFS-20-20]